MKIWYPQGVAIQSKKCAMCRADIPSDYLDHPILLEKLSPQQGHLQEPLIENQWYYEGRNGKLFIFVCEIRSIPTYIYIYLLGWGKSFFIFYIKGQDILFKVYLYLIIININRYVCSMLFDKLLTSCR